MNKLIKNRRKCWKEHVDRMDKDRMVKRAKDRSLDRKREKKNS